MAKEKIEQVVSDDQDSDLLEASEDKDQSLQEFKADADGGTGFATGANIKYYVGSGGGRGFYIGPSFALGIFSFESEYYNPYNGYYDLWYTSFGVWTGVKLGQQFQLSDLFGINLAGNLGAYSDFDLIQLGYSLNLGINFSF